MVRVRLAFSLVSLPGAPPTGEGGAGDWVVEPEDRSGDFRLRVGLPQGFERTLLTTDGAAATTGGRTGSIAIYRHGTPYRLEFALEVRTGSPEDDDERPSPRSERAEEAVAIRREARASEWRGRGVARRADAPARTRPCSCSRPEPFDAG
ncbi:hypothetical protein SAMN06264364_11782 [Quadrisphaera granulorum]|uniref:Uncharacterized protein n=1 Tax=Quadrisphaera granulorum TaxID=317664 RepID=A0A316A774_9ACTN|nr:hypothetical protein [Quadrisphaera granulorum]PWJ52830.1 hypothetical protein BXY45_11782 [Quadrisphaera granulorum]SZE97435.1 hypothetical protein SAMN06264364_11782 [Quadrisphaera granulorum]